MLCCYAPSPPTPHFLSHLSILSVDGRETARKPLLGPCFLHLTAGLDPPFFVYRGNVSARADVFACHAFASVLIASSKVRRIRLSATGTSLARWRLAGWERVAWNGGVGVNGTAVRFERDGCAGGMRV